MFFSKDMAYDLNPLSLPRLQQNELYNIPDVLVRKINENVGVIRFSDILSIAKKNLMSPEEAGYNIIREHGLHDYVSIVNESKFYSNEDYEQAVLESVHKIRLQFDTHIGYDEELFDLLNEAVYYDILNNTTDHLDYILETGLMDGLNDVNHELSHDQRQAAAEIDNATNTIAGKVGKVAQNHVLSTADKWIGQNKPVVDTAAKKIGEKFAQGTEIAMKHGRSVLKNKIDHYTKKTLLIGGGAALATILKKQVRNLTSQETMNSNDPGVLKRSYNALKRILGRLTNREKYCSPKQRGIISSLIYKIKHALYIIARKVGLDK